MPRPAHRAFPCSMTTPPQRWRRGGAGGFAPAPPLPKRGARLCLENTRRSSTELLRRATPRRCFSCGVTRALPAPHHIKKAGVQRAQRLCPRRGPGGLTRTTLTEPWSEETGLFKSRGKQGAGAVAPGGVRGVPVHLPSSLCRRRRHTKTLTEPWVSDKLARRVSTLVIY